MKRDWTDSHARLAVCQRHQNDDLVQTCEWRCDVCNKYQSRYDKPPLAIRCYHLAKGLTNVTDDRQTNEQTNGRPSSSQIAKFVDGGLKMQIVHTLTAVALSMYQKQQGDIAHHRITQNVNVLPNNHVLWFFAALDVILTASCHQRVYNLHILQFLLLLQHKWWACITAALSWLSWLHVLLLDYFLGCSKF